MPNLLYTYRIYMMCKERLIDCFYGISTLGGYLMPNTVFIYQVYMICKDRFIGFYGISTIVGYLMSIPLYTYILNIYDSVGLGFMAYQPL